MKNISWTICFWLVASALSADTKGKDKPKFAVISGTLSSAESEYIQATIYDPDELLLPPRIFDTRSREGLFKLIIPLDRAQDIVLEVSGTPILSNVTGFAIWVEPGDSINIEIPKVKGCNITDVVFSGKGAEKHKFLQELRLVTEAECMGKPWDRSLNQRLDCFIIQRNGFENLVAKYAEQYSVTIPPQVKTLVVLSLAKTVTISFLVNSRNDPQRGLLYTTRFAQEVPLDELLSGNSVCKGLPLFHALYDRAILDLMVGQPAPSDKDEPSRYAVFALLKAKYKTNAICDWLLATCITSQAKIEGWSEELEKMYTEFMELRPERIYASQVRELRKAMTNTLSPGAKAIDFTMKDTTGSDFSMKDFRGKLVVMDFVLTGCGGCATMVPELDKLKQQFHGQNIVFVSIAVDGSLEQAKAGVGRYSSARSTLLYADGKGINHPVVQYYNIVSFPTLILIDKKGKIISPRAPDPRNKEGSDKLYSLIKSNL